MLCVLGFSLAHQACQVALPRWHRDRSPSETSRLPHVLAPWSRPLPQTLQAVKEVSVKFGLSLSGLPHGTSLRFSRSLTLYC